MSSVNYVRYNRITEEPKDCYERYPLTLTTNGSGAVQNVNIPVELVKNGKIVTLIITGQNLGASAATSTIDTTTATAIPPRFRPTTAGSQTYSAVGILPASVNASATSVHIGIVASSGVVHIGNGNLGGTFTSTQNVTLYGGSISWRCT